MPEKQKREWHPWDRLPGESARAYRAFCVYRDLGPKRSVLKAIQAAGENVDSVGRWETWCTQFRWVERAAAYDEWLDRQQREAREEVLRDMARRHAELAMLLLERVRARVEAMKPEELDPGEVARWLEVAARLERLSRGAPTSQERHEVQLGPSWAELAEALLRAESSEPTEGGR